MRSPITIVEVVREVGVGHHDVAPARGLEAGQVGAAVAAPALDHHARSRILRQARGVVLGVVVGDHYLPGRIHAPKRLEGGAHAGLDVLGLVQARDHDRHQRHVRILGAWRRWRRACRGECAHRL
jgi:hypothetical protein